MHKEQHILSYYRFTYYLYIVFILEDIQSIFLLLYLT